MPRKGERMTLAGQKFGRLLVINFSHRTPRRRAFWLCQCECGASLEVDQDNLRSGNTASCGCLRREVTIATSTTHGHAAKDGSPEYESWSAMRARVAATSGERFENYGKRGITCCERWASFENFLADMGPRPEGRTLDRINNDGNYEPGNCRWATASQQVTNRRRLPRRTGLVGSANRTTSSDERGVTP